MEMEGKAITLDEAGKVLQADLTERARLASLGIQTILEQQRCELHTVIEYNQNGQIVSLQYKTVAF
jgi:uncharacterized protein YuzE